MRHPARPGRWIALGLLLALTVFAATGVALAATTQSRASIDRAVAGERFSILRFELETVFNRWLGSVGDWVSGREGHADADVDAFFRGAEPEVSTPQEAAATRRARAELRNRVERILEGRVAAAARAAGLARDLPLFDGQDLLWPPVDVELRAPPRVLLLSPREVVNLDHSVVLNPDLSVEDIERIERLAEADGTRSAYVDRIGGLALYPAIVRDSVTYDRMLELIAHEWTHHYLAFFPLGQAFFKNTNMRTINETVADIVGAEVAAIAMAAHPQPNLPPPSVPPVIRETDPILRDLRREVDALLADGQIETAERRMAEVREELAALGRPIRRINQAYLAFHGVYGASPTSSSPLPPLLFRLRSESESLADFIEKVREVRSVAELGQLASRELE